ncbi:MAG TPA: dTDP-4-dehydrorhamnose reductase [Candidatus Margulisiibacteriota bacterium]|nr:dTDP-4-dehydrorhamnose reductase [Candidatus Margulisiibacteriota bacterium]
MKILVTGAAGQLGTALQASLRGHDLVPLGRAALDITRLAAVREVIDAHRPDLVINAAAFNDVDGAESRPEDAYVGNALGPRNLAVATAARKIAVLHVSSDYVFDGTAKQPYTEFDATKPRSAYGRSKLAGEEAVRALNHRHYIVRTAWLFSTVGRNFAKTMCGLADRPEVRVVSDQYGSPTYVPHLADGLARLIETAAYGTYHMAGKGGASWFELTRTLYRHLGIATPVHPVATADFPRPAERPRYSVLTTLQDPAILLPPWEDGVAACARAMQSNAVG